MNDQMSVSELQNISKSIEKRLNAVKSNEIVIERVIRSLDESIVLGIMYPNRVKEFIMLLDKHGLKPNCGQEVEASKKIYNNSLESFGSFNLSIEACVAILRNRDSFLKNIIKNKLVNVPEYSDALFTIQHVDSTYSDESTQDLVNKIADFCQQTKKMSDDITTLDFMLDQCRKDLNGDF